MKTRWSKLNLSVKNTENSICKKLYWKKTLQVKVFSEHFFTEIVYVKIKYRLCKLYWLKKWKDAMEFTMDAMKIKDRIEDSMDSTQWNENQRTQLGLVDNGLFTT